MKSCKDCDKRKLGCHSDCQDYLTELEEMHRRKKETRSVYYDCSDTLIYSKSKGKYYLRFRR